MDERRLALPGALFVAGFVARPTGLLALPGALPMAVFGRRDCLDGVSCGEAAVRGLGLSAAWDHVMGSATTS